MRRSVAQNNGVMETAQPLPLPSSAPGLVEFEQPLNERMRTFLRLEFLYQQLIHHAEHPSSWDSRAAVSSLLEILAILGRGDVRSEVLKELDRHAELLRAYEQRPGVDGGRLQSLLGNIVMLQDELSQGGSQLTQVLRDCEFLSSIKHRSAIPGGTCEFDLPDYCHWLNQPYEVRAEDLNNWLVVLRPVCDAVAELLWLTRESAEPSEETAIGGMFQHALARHEGRTLLRVVLPSASRIYPEISGGQHRFTVRFLRWTDINRRPVQASKDVKFLLGLCN